MALSLYFQARVEPLSVAHHPALTGVVGADVLLLKEMLLFPSPDGRGGLAAVLDPTQGLSCSQEDPEGSKSTSAVKGPALRCRQQVNGQSGQRTPNAMDMLRGPCMSNGPKRYSQDAGDRRPSSGLVGRLWLGQQASVKVPPPPPTHGLKVPLVGAIK